MSLFVKIFSADETVKANSYLQENTGKPPAGEELLLKKKEFLQRKIDLELVLAKTNCRKNREVALQALKRKKWYENYLKYIDCAVMAVRSAHEHLVTVNKMSAMVKDNTEGQNVTEDMSDSLCPSVGCGVEFDEDELLADLEKLEISLDLFEVKKEENLSKTEEDELEDAFEFLLRWANEPS